MKKYTVKENEDLGSIAQKFGMVSWKYLYQINREAIGDNPDLLKPGTRLEIPRWDATSGDEKIKAKDADPFKYTGGVRYRYPWVPFSLSLVGDDGEPLPDFEEERNVKIVNRKDSSVVAETTVRAATDLEMLLPDGLQVNVGIKGYPFNIKGQLNIHPDDVPPAQQPNQQAEQAGNSDSSEDDILRSLGLQ